MIKQLTIVLLPNEAADESKQLQKASELLNIPKQKITAIRLLKRSIDARSKAVKISLTIEVFIDENPPAEKQENFRFDNDVTNAKPVLIIGCGPAGMFAALRLIEQGLKPVIIERGKNVQQRRRDLAAINKQGVVDPDSNYCFGEGGAGTYSDGKLYTRSSKRGDIERILRIFISHGADENIAIDAHPHIGTNKLPKIIEAMRKTILNAGGEIHLGIRLTNFLIKENRLLGIETEHTGTKAKSEFLANDVILATGHSARDIFELLNEKNILIESKPFALGVRIEHPQQVIDRIQYHCDYRGEFLPPASYSLKHQYDGRGIYSFCMCPGGIIAPAATAPGEIVVNGWSPSKRNNPFANSGVVVSVDEKDFSKYKLTGALAAMKYQSHVEQKSFAAGGGNLRAPAQRMVDFVNGKFSNDLPECSYLPGTTSTMLTDVLPPEISLALKDALKAFGRKMKGYFSNEALLVATESRTSSPVRIPRDNETLQHPQIKGLYPCGEGAGYAGGIVSAAMDGERCANAVAGVVHNDPKSKM
jgi:uncharacterized FAD-dependent dehydrogenase